MRWKNGTGISIHAPARGATYKFCLFDSLRLHFNPRSRKGSDDFLAAELRRIVNFNPRSRKGSDTSCLLIYLLHLDFNPRSRKGSDL